jgi:hypothetical protein
MTPFASLAPVALVASIAALAMGCSDTVTQCECVDPQVRIRLPQARATVLRGVNLSGPACEGVTAACESGASGETAQSAGCEVYVFRPRAIGRCFVNVDFSAGPPRFSAELRIVEKQGCCAGLYADPPSAAAIDVPDDTTDGGGG